MRTAKRIFLLLASLVLISAGTFLIIAVAYEKEVKDYMVQQLNKKLKTKVIVDPDNIRLSLLRDFPYASLRFSHVTMMESPVGRYRNPPKGKQVFYRTDTLFTAGEIALHFNVWDIITRNYRVKKVSAGNGIVKLRKGADGSVNWDVWQKEGDSASVSSDESVFNLEKFEVEHMMLTYSDPRSDAGISASVHSGSIGGEFTSTLYDLSIAGDLRVHRFRIDSVNYLDEKPVRLDLALTADNGKGVYEFDDAEVHISDQAIAVEGKYTDSDPSFIDLFLKGKDMDIRSVLSLLPEKYHEYVSDYDSEGEFFCNMHIFGPWNATLSPEVKADFGITQADITQLSSGILLRQVKLTGNYYASASKDYLELKNFSAELARGSVTGRFRMDNFSSPFISLVVKAGLPLDDVRQLLKADTIWNYPVQSLSGTVKVNMEYKGMLNRSGKYHKPDFEKMNLAGDLLLENAGMKIKNSTLAFDSINGSFVMNDNDIEVSSFSGRTERSDFYFKGFLNNILAYTLTDKAPVTIDAVFHSRRLDLDELLVNQAATAGSDTVYRVGFSPRISFNLNSEIGFLKFRRFEAMDIRGTFRLKDRKLIVDPVSFRSMDGTVTASGMVDGTMDDKILISCDALVNKMNISSLFYQFEDFGQNTLTYRHLRGIGSASIQFAMVMAQDLTVDMNRIYARSNMTVEKGELVSFEPMKALSKYISVSELEDIKFSTLQNQVEVKDQKVYIPKMEIRSSALDVTLSGWHSFQNEIEYHIKVLMSDVLFNKARKAKKENSEFGVVEEDKAGKTSLFLSMTGTVDDPEITYDRLGAKQNLKENLVEEKHTLKQILRDEFGWFRKDTSLNKKEKPKDDGKFIIKWEEEEKEPTIPEDDDF